MMRKAITKKDAIAVAYYLAEKISKRRSVDGATAEFSSKWEGKWHETDFSITGKHFHISAGRVKHSDGRIRDAHSDAEGLIHFALYAVKNFPDAHSTIAAWEKNIKDRELVAGTIENKKAQSIFLEFQEGGRWSFKRLRDEVAMAETLGVLAS